jgi:hypothetical protein
MKVYNYDVQSHIKETFLGFLFIDCGMQYM